MAQWLSYPTFSGPFSGQEQLLAASSTSPGAGMIRIPWSVVSAATGGGGAFLPLTGGSLSGPLTLPGNATLPLQAVPLQQVQAITGGPFLQIAGGTLTGPLTLAADPTVALGAATKEYVDGTVAGGSFLPLTGGTVSGPIVLPGNATLPLQAVPLQQVTSIIGGPYLPLGGGTLTGALVLAADPTLSLGAATKQYVDSAVVSGPFLPLAGGTVTGATTFSADVTFSGASTGLAVSNNATVGGTFVATGGINGTPVGAVTPSTGSFTNLTASGTVTLPSTTTGPFLLLTGGTVSGPTTFSSSGTALSVTNAATVTGQLNVGSTISIGTTVGALGNAIISTPNGSHILINPQGSGQVKIGSGTGTLNTGILNLGNINITGTPINQALVSTLSFTGSNSTGSIVGANNWAVNSDVMAKTGNLLAHTTYNYNFGGAGYSGSRAVLVSSIVQTGAISGAAGQLVEGIQSSVTLAHSWGGTDTAGNSAGSGTALNPFLVFQPGYTNGIGGGIAEFDIAAQAGSTFQKNTGLLLVHTNSHASSGSFGIDTGISLADQSGATVANGWDCGLGFGGTQWPMKSTSSLIAIFQSRIPGAPTDALHGIDFSAGIFSGYPFRGPSGFSVDSSANVQVGTGYLEPTSTGLSIDAHGSIATAVALVSGGSSWPTDSNAYYATDSNGGIYSLTLVSGAVTAVAFYNGQAPIVSGATPSNPVTLTPSSIAAAWGATGLTVNLTWSARTTLSLQPSGGVVKLGSGAFTANGTTVLALSNVGPAGAHATVQEWLTITDSAGTVRYIPCF